MERVFVGIKNQENGLFEAALRGIKTKQWHALLSLQTNSFVWYKKLGHVSAKVINKTIPLLKGVVVGNCQLPELCDTCQISNSKRQPCNERSEYSKMSTAVLELLHCDVQRTFSEESRSGLHYFLVVVNECSELSMKQLLKLKSESGQVLKDVINQMETTTDKRVKKSRTNNAIELLENSFQRWISDKGIILKPTPHYSPETNGKAERIQQTIVNQQDVDFK